MNTAQNILLADDHAIIRNGLEILVSNNSNHFTFFHASNKSEIFDNLSANPIDLIILDLNFEEGSSLPWIQEIKTAYPQVKIIIFSSFDESVYKNRVLSLGASAFVSKLTNPEEIVQIVEQILNTNVKFIKINNSSKLSLLNILSNREMEIALLLTKGFGNLEISNILSIKSTTVSTYKQRIYDKLEIDSLADLIETFKIHQGMNL